ncbi:MAG: PorT family protein [Cyclobacteriaceae bacterium]|nr:PorT family protein [Cyclobacteriaceae bacterium HetDA_MAG_MS6]
MRKFFIISALSLSFVQLGFSQTKLGLKFSPVFANSRVEFLSDSADIENDGSAFRFSIGLVVDYPLTETYYFSTGLVVVPKRVGITVVGENGFTPDNPREEYNLQYLQVPISLKLYTNEIRPDMSIYFQVGGALEIKLNDKPLEEEYQLIEKFDPFDANVMLGAGVEYRAGINTILYGGLNYQRGLLNAVNSSPQLVDELIIRNTVFMIDLGVKF